jgi:hypothetical protein
VLQANPPFSTMFIKASIVNSFLTDLSHLNNGGLQLQTPKVEVEVTEKIQRQKTKISALGSQASG